MCTHCRIACPSAGDQVTGASVIGKLVRVVSTSQASGHRVLDKKVSPLLTSPKHGEAGATVRFPPGASEAFRHRESVDKCLSDVHVSVCAGRGKTEVCLVH